MSFRTPGAIGVRAARSSPAARSRPAGPWAQVCSRRAWARRGAPRTVAGLPRLVAEAKFRWHGWRLLFPDHLGERCFSVLVHRTCYSILLTAVGGTGGTCWRCPHVTDRTQPWGPAGSCRTGIGVQGASHLSPRALQGGLFSMPSLSPVITPRTLLTTLNARLQVLTGNRIDQKVASGYQRTRVSVPHAHGDSGSLCGSSFWVRLTVPNAYRFLLIKLLLVQKSH